MKDDKFKKQTIISILAIIVLIISVIGVSYSVFTVSLGGTRENLVTTGTISMSYDELTNGIVLTDAMPLTDEVGKALTDEGQVFDFTVSAKISGVTSINYEVVAQKVNLGSEQLKDGDVKLYLEKKTSESYSPTLITATPQNFIPLTTDSDVGSPSGSMVLYSSTFSNTTYKTNTYSENFRLRMWLSDNYKVETTAKKFQVKINIYSSAL